MPPKSTELRVEHFDENVYAATSDTILYKFLDAMCGDAGAGSLKKEIFLQRLSGAMEGIYGSDLDYIFGNVRFLSRTGSESYTYDTMTAMLTADQWDEVRVKDAQYRSRIREFFIAAANGNTVEGVRQAVHAATSSDCQVLETWRYYDSFGLSEGLGRATGLSYAATSLTTGHRVLFTDMNSSVAKANATAYVTARADKDNWLVEKIQARSELTVVPFKQNLTPREARLLRGMLDRITPQDSIVTINPDGLSVQVPVRVASAAADSCYFQVEKTVTPTPAVSDLPAPELLAVDLDPTEKWLWSRSPELAPYAQFNITQEYGYYYLISGGARSPIDSVGYGTLQADGSVVTEKPFEWFEQTEQYGPWFPYDKADSPDNYPGGKQGLTPNSAPARNPDRSGYRFPYASQAAYIAAKKAEVLSVGGEADDQRYRLPIEKPSSFKRTFTPDLSIAYTAPVRESTITSSWTSRRPRRSTTELRNPSSFVRS
jgi:hypothetical protein